MTKRKSRPNSVFVPYEILTSGVVVRLRDLPRFVEPHQVMKFLHDHQELSSRRLDWREEWERESVNEYMAGIGEDEKPVPELIKFTDKPS